MAFQSDWLGVPEACSECFRVLVLTRKDPLASSSLHFRASGAPLKSKAGPLRSRPGHQTASKAISSAC